MDKKVLSESNVDLSCFSSTITSGATDGLKDDSKMVELQSNHSLTNPNQAIGDVENDPKSVDQDDEDTKSLTNYQKNSLSLQSLSSMDAKSALSSITVKEGYWVSQQDCNGVLFKLLWIGKKYDTVCLLPP